MNNIWINYTKLFLFAQDYFCQMAKVLFKFVCDRKNIMNYIIEKDMCVFVRIYQIFLEINIDRV